MNWKFFLYGIAAAALLPAVVCAQASFDSSGNSLLNGTYFIREVLNANISSIGQIGKLNRSPVRSASAAGPTR